MDLRPVEPRLPGPPSKMAPVLEFQLIQPSVLSLLASDVGSDHILIPHRVEAKHTTCDAAYLAPSPAIKMAGEGWTRLRLGLSELQTQR